jgi:hypothetical protein
LKGADDVVGCTNTDVSAFGSVCLCAASASKFTVAAGSGVGQALFNFMLHKFGVGVGNEGELVPSRPLLP